MNTDLTDQDDEQTRRQKALKDHRDRVREMTKLEQVAFKERKVLPMRFQPYTEPELEEALALRAEIERVMKRAQALADRVMRRLETTGTPETQLLLKGFRAQTPSKIYIPPVLSRAELEQEMLPRLRSREPLPSPISTPFPSLPYSGGSGMETGR